MRWMRVTASTAETQSHPNHKNMNDKNQILSMLDDIFNRWAELLANLGEEQIAVPLLPSSWSVKDVIAHLWGWQQISLARAEAALSNKEPIYPGWWEMFGPDPEEDVDRTNAWIYENSRDKPWTNVYTDWKTQFLRYLELIKEIPEKDLLEHGRYKWMGKYALSDSCMGSYEHHEEHMDKLLAWLREQKVSP